MSKTVSNICHFCDKVIKPNSSVVFISGAIAKPYYKPQYLDIQFLGKRNPRAVIHRECWDEFFYEEVKPKNKKKEKQSNRLDNIE